MLNVRDIRGGHAFYPAGATFGPRVLGDYEFVLIQQGEARYIADGRTYAAPPGTVILARPGFHERYFWDEQGPTRHLFFHFTLSAVPRDLGSPRQWPVAQRMPAGDPVRPLFAFVVDVVTASAERRADATICRAVETMLSAFVRGPVASSAVQPVVAPEAVLLALAHTRRVLHENPAAVVTLEQLAEAAHVHKHHLCRLFAASLDARPMQVVLAFRMQHALTLMARSDLKLERIAQLCGFATVFHFSRRFAQFFGEPPSRVRANLAAGQAPVHELVTLINRVRG